jgi:hypothetical protein
MSFSIVGYYIWLTHKEKIEIIKRGETGFENNYLKNLKHSVLSKGILLVSLAAGMGIGYTITLNINGISQLVIYLICLLGSGGIGLLIYYFIIRKEE